MKVFKLFWAKRHDGVWHITAMQGLDLKGDRPADEDFFPVQDDIVVTQGAPLPGTIRSVMGESIVPVVARSEGENTLRCIGTAFFVSCSGLLITAAHVITDPIERKYGNVAELDDVTWQAKSLHFGVLVPTNPLFEARGFRFYPFEWCMMLAEKRPHPLPIAGIDLKFTTDIAICKIAPRPDGSAHQPLTTIQQGMQGVGTKVGRVASAVGYAGMADTELSLTPQGTITGNLNFLLHVSTGKIIEQFPDNLHQKEVSTPGPCFSFSAKVPGGMSGAPIFDHEGIYVHGVVSKGLEDENGIAPLSFGSMLAPSLGLPIARMNGASLLALRASHGEGIPNLQGGGL